MSPMSWYCGSQLTHTGEAATDLGEGGFSRLHHADAVVGVSDSRTEGADLGPHDLGNGETCGVVCSLSDTKARAEVIEVFTQSLLRAGEMLLGKDTSNVCINSKSHDFLHMSGLRGGAITFGSSGVSESWGVA